MSDVMLKLTLFNDVKRDHPTTRRQVTLSQCRHETATPLIRTSPPGAAAHQPLSLTWRDASGWLMAGASTTSALLACSHTMPDDLETRLLDGQGLEAPQSASPARSPDSDAANTDDELGSDLSGPSSSGPRPPDDHATSALPPRDGPQTGIKGVIKDAEQRKAIDRELHRQRVSQTNTHLLAQAFQAQTIEEEDAERKREQGGAADDEMRKEWRRKRERLLREKTGNGTQRFGLREVGERTFVQAVERPGWVLVMIHEPVGAEARYQK